MSQETQAQAPAAENGARREVARRDTTPLMRRDPMGLAHHFAKSGYFKDAKAVSQAVVKIVAGEELGIGPMASMQGIHFIKGKLALSANLQAVQVQRSENCRYRIVDSTAETCKLSWLRNGEEIGTSEFTIAQAEQAGLVKPESGWCTYPEDMLFARALTRGIRRFCPEVLAGTPAYTPEELGAEVDQSGEPIFVESQQVDEEFVPLAALSPESVEHLLKGIDLAAPSLEASGVNRLDGLNVLLGSLGIDGFNPNDPLADQVAQLTDEQAADLDAELQKLVDEAEGGSGSGD